MHGQQNVKIINPIWNKEELLEEWKSQSLYLFTRKVIEQIVVYTVYRSKILSTAYSILSILLSTLTPYAEEIIRRKSVWISRKQVYY